MAVKEMTVCMSLKIACPQPVTLSAKLLVHIQSCCIGAQDLCAALSACHLHAVDPPLALSDGPDRLTHRLQSARQMKLVRYEMERHSELKSARVYSCV